MAAPPTAAVKDTKRPATAPVEKTLPTKAAGAAFAVLEAEADGVEVPEEPEEGVPELEEPLALRRAVRVESEVKSTVTVAFLQSERVGAVPETKFTAAHCGCVLV